jgi:hypothetical protein
VLSRLTASRKQSRERLVLKQRAKGVCHMHRQTAFREGCPGDTLGFTWSQTRGLWMERPEENSTGVFPREERLAPSCRRINCLEFATSVSVGLSPTTRSWLKVVSEFVKGAAESFRGSKAWKAQHRVVLTAAYVRSESHDGSFAPFFLNIPAPLCPAWLPRSVGAGDRREHNVGEP